MINEQYLYVKVIIILSLLLVSQILCAETNGNSTNTIEQDSLASLKSILPTVDLHKYYDLVPGDEGWRELSYPEKLQSLQLKEETLHKIPTSDLLDICLYNYLILTIDFFDNPFAELYNITQRYNMYPELLSRDDSYLLIANKYISLDYNEVLKGFESKKFSPGRLLCVYAYIMDANLLLNSKVFDKLNDSLLCSILQKATAEYSILHSKDAESPFHLVPEIDCSIMYRILLKLNYEPLINDSNLKTELSTNRYGILSKSTKQLIFTRATEFLDNKE